jgi:hypothetical protein
MFRLSVYDYPACQGSPCHAQESFFETAEAALERASSIDKDGFSYASLCAVSAGDYSPCDWTGRVIADNESWPRIQGNRREHPAMTALRQDLRYLVTEINRQADETHRGTIYIAGELLSRRHPLICGWAERLATMAYDSRAQ